MVVHLSELIIVTNCNDNSRGSRLGDHWSGSYQNELILHPRMFQVTLIVGPTVKKKSCSRSDDVNSPHPPPHRLVTSQQLVAVSLQSSRWFYRHLAVW